MTKLWVFAAAIFLLVGCGPQAPCDDSDPIGPCATSHSKTYGGS